MKSTENITLCLPGGHLSPALAVAEYCQQHYPNVAIVFIGRATNFEHEQATSIESTAMAAFSKRVYTIRTGRFTVTGSIHFLLGVVDAVKILRKERPNGILSFGGYVALPIVIAGVLLRIPIVTHEQTHGMGRANKIISFFAKKVCVSFPEMVAQVQQKKGLYTGFPLRPGLFFPPVAPSFAVEKELPCIFITGGTTGATSLNELLFPIIPELVSRFMIIHQTGNLSLEKAQALQRSLPTKLQSRYLVAPYYSTVDTAWTLSHAAFVISRAGANTVWEMAELGIPSILVPLPWAAKNEQQKNALWLAAHNGALVLDQQQLQSSKMLQSVNTMDTEWKKYKASAVNFSKELPRDGTQKIIEEMIRTIS